MKLATKDQIEMEATVLRAMPIGRLVWTGELRDRIKRAGVNVEIGNIRAALTRLQGRGMVKVEPLSEKIKGYIRLA